MVESAWPVTDDMLPNTQRLHTDLKHGKELCNNHRAAAGAEPATMQGYGSESKLDPSGISAKSTIIKNSFKKAEPTYKLHHLNSELSCVIIFLVFVKMFFKDYIEVETIF